MKLKIKMPRSLKPFYQNELNEAVIAFKNKHYKISWRHLERAHILAQPSPLEHTSVHWNMLCFGFKIKNLKEVTGQIPRLLFGGVKSFVGHIPVGNTGGADVPPLLPMEIPKDLAEIIHNTKSV